MFFLMAVPAFADTPAPAPSAVPTELLDPHSPHVLAAKCQGLIKEWALTRSLAQEGLAGVSCTALTTLVKS